LFFLFSFMTRTGEVSMSEQTIFDASAVLALANLLLAGLAWRGTTVLALQLRHMVALTTERNRHAAITRFQDDGELHRTLARLIADASDLPTQLMSESLSCAAVPAPFLTATRVDGVRIYVTQQPQMLRKLRMMRSGQRSINITRGAATRRMEMCAIWEAACIRNHTPQTALPEHQDWHALFVHVSAPATPGAASTRGAA